MRATDSFLENLVYPGDYVPMLARDEVKERLSQPKDGNMLLPPVNITELESFFKVEMAIPGVNREDFIIDADENVITISLLHKSCGTEYPASFQVHEFNFECFQRHIILPGNVDTEFVAAEYKNGLLCIYVPKTSEQCSNLHSNIVVY